MTFRKIVIVSLAIAAMLQTHTPAGAAAPLRGEVISTGLDNSEIFPGTSRRIQVYVPAEYDGKTPACLLVYMDGGADFIASHMDTLIAEGSMPVTIGVFIDPGRIRDEEGNYVRFNRSNEYDRVDGRFASFIEKEVLPLVSSLSSSDGRKVMISGRASDHLIMGGSSGGICAFNAAFQRPDLFGRVYSVIGTFVSFRGGDQYPAIIRKSEPRPMRVFLQDNMDDSWNLLFGSWFEYNRLMLSALEFSGYDVRHQWNEGGHDGRPGVAIMDDVLRWIWSGWPAGIKAGKTGNKALQDIVGDNPDWKLLKEDMEAGASLAPLDGTGILLNEGRRAYTVTPEGEISPFKGRVPEYDPYRAVFPGGSHVARRAEGSNWVWDYIVKEGKEVFGQEFYFLYTDAGQILFDDKGYLYCATSVGIQICDQNGRVRAILSLPGGRVDSIAFAGSKLFAISGGRLYVRTLRRSGSFTSAPSSEGEG